MGFQSPSLAHGCETLRNRHDFILRPSIHRNLGKGKRKDFYYLFIHSNQVSWCSLIPYVLCQVCVHFSKVLIYRLGLSGSVRQYLLIPIIIIAVIANEIPAAHRIVISQSVSFHFSTRVNPMGSGS